MQRTPLARHQCIAHSSCPISTHIALTVAERAAIPYGKHLSAEEMESLMGDLLRLPQPNYTPAGKTVICMLPLDKIAAMFS